MCYGTRPDHRQWREADPDGGQEPCQSLGAHSIQRCGQKAGSHHSPRPRSPPQQHREQMSYKTLCQTHNFPSDNGWLIVAPGPTPGPSETGRVGRGDDTNARRLWPETLPPSVSVLPPPSSPERCVAKAMVSRCTPSGGKRYSCWHQGNGSSSSGGLDSNANHQVETRGQRVYEFLKGSLLITKMV